MTFDSGSVRAWLFGVATHVIGNSARAVRRHRDLLARIPAPPVAVDHADEVAARVDIDRDSARIRAAIGRLRGTDRDVLSLAVLGELSYPEIAAALNLPVGTVRSRLSRDRTRLRADLDSTAAGLSASDPPLCRGIDQATVLPTARGDLR